MVKQPIMAGGGMKLSLDDLSWAKIRQIADAGEARKYFKVGDKKAVYLSGTASRLSLDTTYYAYILGFDHNAENDPTAKNTIDFGTFKDADGKDICLVSGWDFNSDFYMNPSPDTNVGGWKGSAMRYSILGSTNVENGDATAAAATSPIPNTLMSCLPGDLRAVMKPMTIYTDNVGGGTDEAANVTATVDYLPLLAEYEIFGKNRYANTNEPKNQMQYEYFKTGSGVKYRHDETSSTILWWERSPSPRDGKSTTFCFVSEGGSASYIGAHGSCGVAPVFRV